jgi:hypothetical protein
MQVPNRARKLPEQEKPELRAMRRYSESRDMRRERVIMPQKFVLEITLGNEGMQNSEDVKHALTDVIAALDRDYPDAILCTWAGLCNGGIRDINGNVVGHYEVI